MEAELCENITPRVELQKRNFLKILPSSAYVRKRNIARRFLLSWEAEAELCHDISPQSGVAKVQLHKDITSKIDLRKRTFVKTFPLKQSCGRGTSRRNYPRVELLKRNFGKTCPTEGSCESGTLRRNYPQGWIAEAELRFDIQGWICGSRTSPWHYLQSGVATAELCKDITPRAELRKWNFAMTLPRKWSRGSRTSQRHYSLGGTAEAEFHEAISPKVELKGLAFWLDCMWSTLVFFVTFPCDVPGRYLIVSIPDLCLLTYFSDAELHEDIPP